MRWSWLGALLLVCRVSPPAAAADGFLPPVATDGLAAWSWPEDGRFLATRDGGEGCGLTFVSGHEWTAPSAEPVEVRAMADGVVEAIADGGAQWGHVVVVRHDRPASPLVLRDQPRETTRTVWTQYARLSSLSAGLELDQPVSRGQPIGAIAPREADGAPPTLGRPTLHWEVRRKPPLGELDNGAGIPAIHSLCRLGPDYVSAYYTDPTAFLRLNPVDDAAWASREAMAGAMDVTASPGEVIDVALSFRNLGSGEWRRDPALPEGVELWAVDAEADPRPNPWCTGWLPANEEAADCVRVAAAAADNMPAPQPGSSGGLATFRFTLTVPTDAPLDAPPVDHLFSLRNRRSGIFGRDRAVIRVQVVAPPQCEVGAVDGPDECGLCGTRERVCSPEERWAAWSECRGEGPCDRGDTARDGAGCTCGTQERRCDDHCEWGAWGACSATPNACGGCGALAHRPGDRCGDCDDGRWACDGRDAVRCEGASRLNACGECGAVPRDVCNLIDDDCDGSKDEGLTCFNRVHRCYKGFPENGRDEDHTYIVEGAERCPSGYRDEGVKFRTFINAAGGRLTPLYRKYRASDHDHMVTVNRGEGEDRPNADERYVPNGEVGFCSAVDNRAGINLGPVTQSLWELFSVETRNHIHTISTAERDALWNGAYDDGGRRDVRECFVWPP